MAHIHNPNTQGIKVGGGKFKVIFSKFDASLIHETLPKNTNKMQFNDFCFTHLLPYPPVCIRTEDLRYEKVGRPMSPLYAKCLEQVQMLVISVDKLKFAHKMTCKLTH